ncbi:hypothetical protein LINPERHAP1_LOCUS7649 [Linum perenne]
MWPSSDSICPKKQLAWFLVWHHPEMVAVRICGLGDSKETVIFALNLLISSSQRLTASSLPLSRKLSGDGEGRIGCAAFSGWLDMTIS